MLPHERVDGGVLLPLDQLHKRARDAGVLRMPNQVFIPDDVIAFLGPPPGPEDIQRLTGFDPAVEAEKVSVEQKKFEHPADELFAPVGHAGSRLAEPPSTVKTPADRTGFGLNAFIKEMNLKHTGRPDGAPKPASTTDIRERVRRQVQGSEDEATTRQTLEQELENITLSSDQEAAFNGIVGASTTSTILTGEAGTGKSTVVKKVRSRQAVALCATTGIAAMNIGACTIDSMFSYDRTTNDVRSLKRRDMIMEIIPRTIIIDEASMIGAKMAKYVLDVAKAYGKRLVLVGDWAQAAPVKDGWATETELVMRAATHKLVEVHRQSDQRYLSALNAIRRGEVTPDAREVFSQCLVPGPPDDDTYLRFFATNATADAYNQNRLFGVPESTKIWRLFAEYFDDRDESMQEKFPVPIDVQNKALESSRMAHNTQFRIGARVMIRLNDPSDERRYVNGDLGTIVGARLSDGSDIEEAPPFNPFAGGGALEPTPSYVLVRLDRDGSTVEIGRMSQEVKDALGKPHFTIRGIPLTLGWAITIHKSQGLTVDKAYLDMETITYMKGESKHGLAYVAMSRTRTLEGLLIGNWRDDAVYCSPHVKGLI